MGVVGPSASESAVSQKALQFLKMKVRPSTPAVLYTAGPAECALQLEAEKLRSSELEAERAKVLRGEGRRKKLLITDNGLRAADPV